MGRSRQGRRDRASAVDYTPVSCKRGTDRSGQIADMVSIHVRPPEVDDWVMPDHGEGVSTKGAGNQSSVGVLVELHQPPAAAGDDGRGYRSLCTGRLHCHAELGRCTPAPELHLRPGQGLKRALTSRSTVRTNSTPSPTASAVDLVLSMLFIRHSRCSNACSQRLRYPQLPFANPL
jgi:hypothetical protein